MSRCADEPLDRLSHCQDKLYCLYCLNMEDVGLHSRGSVGLAFLLRDIAQDLEEIEKELLAEKRGVSTQDEAPEV